MFRRLENTSLDFQILNRQADLNLKNYKSGTGVFPLLDTHFNVAGVSLPISKSESNTRWSYNSFLRSQTLHRVTQRMISAETLESMAASAEENGQFQW